jgi:hypothetical protein
MKSPVIFVSDTRTTSVRFWRIGKNGGPQLGESRRKLRASSIGLSLFRPSIISKEVSSFRVPSFSTRCSLQEPVMSAWWDASMTD